MRARTRRKGSATFDEDRHDAPESTQVSLGEPPQGRCWDVQEFRQRGGDPNDGTRVNCGAIYLPVVNEMRVEFQFDETEQILLALVVLIDQITIKINAFAAPRSGGLWAQMRAELAEQLRDHGGSANEQPGPFGPELLAVLPPQAGPHQGEPARFVGLEGPRWLVQAVIAGAGATDPHAGEVAQTLLRQIVVVRGEAALPRGALLQLTIPEQVAQQFADDQARQGQQGGASPYRQGDLNPYARGPEISEVR